MSRRRYTSQEDNDRAAPVRPFVCELDFGWKTRLILGGVTAAIFFAASFVVRSLNFDGIVMIVLACYAVYALWIWLCCRSWLEVTDDYQLKTRRFGRMHTVDGEAVVRVEEIVAGRSPDIRLRLRDGSVVVPTSRLAAGHRVLYVWLAALAPQATYDDRAAKIRRKLAADGWPVGLEPAA